MATITISHDLTETRRHEMIIHLRAAIIGETRRIFMISGLLNCYITTYGTAICHLDFNISTLLYTEMA